MMKKMMYATIVIAMNRTIAQRMRRIRYWTTMQRTFLLPGRVFARAYRSIDARNRGSETIAHRFIIG